MTDTLITSPHSTYPTPANVQAYSSITTLRLVYSRQFIEHGQVTPELRIQIEYPLNTSPK